MIDLQAIFDINLKLVHLDVIFFYFLRAQTILCCFYVDLKLFLL